MSDLTTIIASVVLGYIFAGLLVPDEGWHLGRGLVCVKWCGLVVGALRVASGIVHLGRDGERLGGLDGGGAGYEWGRHF